jgi:hypothetical protein
VELDGLDLIVEPATPPGEPAGSGAEPPDRPLPTDQPTAKEAPS